MMDIEQRHKLERKELQATIQSLKSSIPKGDKKKKRQVTTDIARLQAELDERHAEELEQHKVAEDSVNGVAALSMTEEEAVPAKSKAQKRREKKEAEERERQQRLTEGEKESVNHSRNVEAGQFQNQLREKNLKIIDITPDGNCLYNSIVYHLHGAVLESKMTELREKTSSYMLENAGDFLPFTSSSTTGDMMGQDEYESYCSDIKNTNSWGGQLELRAISQIYEQPIEILQASAPPLLIGDGFNKQKICLSYHRHQYGLGEHYNAVVPTDSEQ